MYKLLNPKNERGDYAFKGKEIVTRGCNLNVLQKDIDHIKRQIREYTKKHTRDYILYFRNEHGEEVHAVDNISLGEIEEEKQKATPKEEIQGHNYYELKYWG
ncbi:MAG: hypothetical protein GKR88_16120 [Flavobacteriaceae bacterium]|nr:MAG: hypothetical protein GKR88_16120 [Flavobacteriaceae bacterium]